MRTLVVYYSLTGNTRKVSELLAARLGADTAEFTCKAYGGALGGLRQAWDMLAGGAPPIEVPAAVGATYDLIVAAGPVWAARPAPPLRTFVRTHLHARDRIAVFLTCGGTSKAFPGEKGLSEVLTALPHAPVATRLFREAEIASPGIEDNIEAFAQEIERIDAAPRPVAAAEAQTAADATGAQRPRRSSADRPKRGKPS